MNFSGVVFLSVEEVERVHAAAMSVDGGLVGVRDRGLLASAVATPQTTLFGAPAHPSLARMAAALAWALARNHPFIDGNKRVAALSAVVFLQANGHHIHMPKDPWSDVFVSVAAGIVTRDDLAAMLAREIGVNILVEADSP